jgi:endogenous inhibitor of DNA gyrase (YacG/DUF329 family)
MSTRPRAGAPQQEPAGRNPGTACPICRKPSAARAGDGETSPYPFCSERCKLIDLGRWLDGAYQIPLEPSENGGSPPAPEAEEGGTGGPD